jgi:hypothetical protein
VRPGHSPSIRSALPRGEEGEPRESGVALKDRADLAYAAQTESGDKVIAIRGHVSIVGGVPEGHGKDMFLRGEPEAGM